MFLLLLLSSLSFASTDVASSMVPRGKVVETYGRDFIVRTPSGTRISVEFSLDGKFQEAFGKNLNKGDELEPGEGLLSLSTAAHLLQKSGHRPQGHWTIEKDEKHGWIYEFESVVMNAKTGEIIISRPVPVEDTISLK